MSDLPFEYSLVLSHRHLSASQIRASHYIFLWRNMFHAKIRPSVYIPPFLPSLNCLLCWALDTTLPRVLHVTAINLYRI